jgi:exosome complex RNA-binding protein Csl4
MGKYRKLPVEIEAIQFKRGNFQELEEFVGGDAEFRNGELVIATMEGAMHASPEDWIIRGVKGEFYPCKPDIFAATYEEVTK